MNSFVTEMCSGSEEGSYLRLIDFVYHSIIGLRVIKKKKKPPSLAHTHNLTMGTREVDVRLPGKGDSNSHGARPVHPIITMIKWIRTMGRAGGGIRLSACV